MNLAPSDEQRELRSTARDFLSSRMPLARVTEVIDRHPGWDPALWAEIAELGWTGVTVPENLGGSELGLAEDAIVAEEAAAALLPAPLFSTVGLALPVLLAAGEREITAQVARGTVRATFAWAEPNGVSALSESSLASTSARHEDSLWVIDGTKASVPDAGRVDVILLVAATADGPAVFAAEAADVGVEPVDALDRTRPVATTHFLLTPATLIADAAATPGVLERARARTLTLAAAEAVGISRHVLDVSVEYARNREQFGRAIGTYQGVSHQLADTYVELELSRSLVTWAALAIDADDPLAAAAAGTAAACAIPRAITACERAIQIHGGIGTTWESPLHRYYKRAIALGTLDGPSWRQRSTVRAQLTHTGAW